jgi:hypothetical protein
MPLMVLLGLGVREGAAPLNGWTPQVSGPPQVFGPPQWLLLFTDPRTANAVLIAALAAALYRRLWAALPMILAIPLVSIGAAAGFQRLFGAPSGQGPAYPSSQTTLMVVVLGMLVLAVGVRRWLTAAAVVFVLLGIAGQSVDLHNLTDSLGALLLGTSLVAVAASILRKLRLRL